MSVCPSILQNWYGGQYFRSFTSHELFPAQAAGVGASARVQAAETCQSQGRDRDFGLLVLSPPPSLSAPHASAPAWLFLGAGVSIHRTGRRQMKSTPQKRLKEIPRPSQQELRAAPVFRGRHGPGSGLTGGFSATPGPDPGFCDPVLICPGFQDCGIQKR